MFDDVERAGVTPAARDFCRRILKGEAPGPLPPAPAECDRLISLLHHHRLLGLWRVEHPESLDAGAPGTNVQAAVAATVTLQALRGALTLDAAERARAALLRAGFEVLVFKGVGLIRAGVYPDARARALGDADLLVRGGEPREAVEVLQDAGFEPWTPWQEGREAWLPACTLGDGQAPPEMDIAVDLHWRIPYGSLRSGDEGRGEEVWEGADRALDVPSPEVQALLTAEHFVRHLRVAPHLIAVADLVRLLPFVGDPAWLRRLAEARSSLRVLQRVLWLLEAELEVRLDPELEETLAVPRRLGPWNARSLRLEQLLVVSPGRSQGRLAGLLTESLLRGSPLEALKEVLGVVTPSDEWLLRRAGASAHGPARARLAYYRELVRWMAGRGASPLSPNQEFEGPTGRP